MLNKYLFALGRGVRGARKALDEAARLSDPAARARDITPPPGSPADDPRDSTPTIAPPVASRPKALRLGARPLVMGIINVTPDSFSDGGQFSDSAQAIAHGLRLIEEGADIVDIGGESTRPGHAPVDVGEEMRRVLPVVRGLAAANVPVSIDTMKADVARAALDAGASIVNDVWGLHYDPDMARVVAEAGVPIIVMHNREHDDPSVDMLSEVLAFLSRSIEIATAAGVARDKIIIDPGIGFGKTHAQSLALLRELPRLESLGCPVLLGVSRKRFIGHVTGRDVARDRVAGSLAAAVIGAMQGAAIIRVHDVAAHVDAMKIVAAIKDPTVEDAP